MAEPRRNSVLAMQTVTTTVVGLGLREFPRGQAIRL